MALIKGLSIKEQMMTLNSAGVLHVKDELTDSLESGGNYSFLQNN
jgi:hypothetical protein